MHKEIDDLLKRFEKEFVIRTILRLTLIILIWIRVDWTVGLFSLLITIEFEAVTHILTKE